MKLIKYNESMLVVEFVFSILKDPKVLAFIIWITVWILFRGLIPDKSRRGVILGLLTSAIVLNPIIGGIWYHPTDFGALNAALTWTLISLALLELILLKERRSLSSIQNSLIHLFLLYWFVAVVFFIYQGVSIRPQLFYVPFLLLIIKYSAPSSADLRLIWPTVGGVIVLLGTIFIAGYETPLSNGIRNDYYSVNSQYGNQVWELFGNVDRYRGPFTHPNSAGLNIGFLCVLLLFSRKRYLRIPLLIGVLLLALTSSRTSMIATFFAFVLFAVTANVSAKKTFRIYQYVKYIVIALIPMSFVVIPTYRSNVTLNGRTSIWLKGLEDYLSEPFFGVGISSKPVESSFITTLLYMGLIGGFFLVFMLIKLFRAQLKASPSNQKFMLAISSYIFIVSLGENILLPYSFGISTLAFIIIVVLCGSDSFIPSVDKLPTSSKSRSKS